MPPESPTLASVFYTTLLALAYLVITSWLQRRASNDIKQHAKKLVEEPIRQVRQESAQRDEAAAITIRQVQDVLGTFTLSMKVNAESYQASIADLRKAKTEREEEFESLIANRDREMAGLQNDYSNLQTQYKLVIGRLETTGGTLTQLMDWKESQLLASGRRDEEIGKLQQDGKKMSDQLQQEHDAAEKMRQELERTQGELEATKDALKKANARIQDLEKQHAAETQTSQDEKQTLILERDSLKEKVEALEREVATLRSQVRELQNQQPATPEQTKQDLPPDAANNKEL